MLRQRMCQTAQCDQAAFCSSTPLSSKETRHADSKGRTYLVELAGPEHAIEHFQQHEVPAEGCK